MDSDGFRWTHGVGKHDALLKEPNIEQCCGGTNIWDTIFCTLSGSQEVTVLERAGPGKHLVGFSRDPHRSVTVKLVLDHTFPYHVPGQRWLLQPPLVLGMFGMYLIFWL